MKKIVSALLSVAVLISSLMSLSFSVFADEVSDSLNVIEYEVLEDDTVKITRYDSLDTIYNIPSEINGKAVTVIGKKAFRECHALTTVTIPDTVTTIENQAFEKCEHLSVVELGNSVKTLGYKAFADCKVLKSVALPQSLETIGNNCFVRCFKLDNITIPSSVTSIGDYAFSDCTGLSNLIFENGELTIGQYAFGWCLKLTEITLGDNVKELKSDAFVACDGVNQFTIENENCIIVDSLNTIPENAVIYGYENSTAHKYSIKYEREFVALEKQFEKLLGDSDLDGKVTILDATAIQYYLADTLPLSDNALINADADEDSVVSVIDATQIQRILAQLC